MTQFSPNGHPPESRKAKEAAGFAAAHHVQSGMLVGLGTGSTVAFFLQALGRRCREDLQITAVPSSRQTQMIAEREGIPLIASQDVAFLDLTVDGADEIDDQHQMIKGGGGALLREKILASSSREVIIIVDQAKRVPRLGQHPLPVEIAAFGATATVTKLERLGYQAVLRRDASGECFISDNGNWIVDLDIAQQNQDPRAMDRSMRSVTGVLETGFFFDMVTRLIVGYEDGHVEEHEC